MTYNKDSIKSVAEFVNKVIDLMDEIKLDNEDALWFRGESRLDYSLVPNLYRKVNDGAVEYCTDILFSRKIYQVEQNIDANFARKSSSFFSMKGIENTSWNRYFLKQHYGITTRLLDWTENALYALFFAVNDERKHSIDGKVYVLSPHKLNNFSLNHIFKTKKEFYMIPSCGKLEKKGPLINENKEYRMKEVLRKYYRMDFEKEEKSYPLAIYPPHLDERMSAQQACFTIFGNMVKGLDSLEENETILSHIKINAASKAKILKELRQLGVSYYSIYPDLDGLGKTINFDHLYQRSETLNDNDFYNLVF